jgi:hypothetical protein
VAQLEEENSRLQALADKGGSEYRKTTPDEELLQQVEQLQAKLAAAEERERQIKATLLKNGGTPEAEVKMETDESVYPSKGSLRSNPKTGSASLGFMVSSETLI